ncbi:hypothetical protein CSKR_114478 [Clonorchis sinensis]|uniref:CWH43-like N-terminal domain-containing protein n=1 Tax=Clonorchis sinensis TaxID=79923 RepID=A0A3R7G5U5_CLOSI|nr:hypothetical protein CSKR_114478 [Clonorchis sinensis]
MAASLDHISILFPYISDTGTWVPESCIFGQLLNMAATLSKWYTNFALVSAQTKGVEHQLDSFC